MHLCRESLPDLRLVEGHRPPLQVLPRLCFGSLEMIIIHFQGARQNLFCCKLRWDSPRDMKTLCCASKLSFYQRIIGGLPHPPPQKMTYVTFWRAEVWKRCTFLLNFTTLSPAFKVLHYLLIHSCRYTMYRRYVHRILVRLSCHCFNGRCRYKWIPLSRILLCI